MNDIINQYLTQFILLLILAVAAWMGGAAKNLYRKYVTTEIKQAVCRTAVRFVEQVYVDLHGPEKLREAMAKASNMLEEQGITITESELVALIEAAVNEFNNAFGRTGAAAGRHETGTTTFGGAVEDPELIPEVTAEEVIAEIVEM